MKIAPPLRVLFLVLGLLEYFNAATAIINPIAALTPNPLVGHPTILALATSNNHMITSYARTYAWSLFGLGSIRLAYAFDRHKKPNSMITSLNVISHIAESLYWWQEACSSVTASGVFGVSAGGEGSIIVKVMMNMFKEGVDPMIPVLLIGPPLLGLLLVWDLFKSR